MRRRRTRQVVPPDIIREGDKKIRISASKVAGVTRRGRRRKGGKLQASLALLPAQAWRFFDASPKSRSFRRCANSRKIVAARRFRRGGAFSCQNSRKRDDEYRGRQVRASCTTWRRISRRTRGNSSRRPFPSFSCLTLGEASVVGCKIEARKQRKTSG